MMKSLKYFKELSFQGFNYLQKLLVTTCILLLLFLAAPIATITASILLGGSVFMFFKFFRKKISNLRY